MAGRQQPAAGGRCAGAGGRHDRHGRGVTTVGLSPEDGKVLREFQGYDGAWRTATDGTALYGVRRPDAADKALAVVPLPLDTSGEQAPLVRLPAFDGGQVLNQILGVAGDTVFLCAKAAGSQQWFVVAAQLKSGKELWRQPTTAPSADAVKRQHPLPVRAKAVPGGVLLWQRAEQGDALRVSLHDAGSGAERWSAALSALGATPTSWSRTRSTSTSARRPSRRCGSPTARWPGPSERTATSAR